MSGNTIPAPHAIDPGPNSFWYTLPVYDVAMVDKAGPLSLNPGAMCLVDLDAPILRDKCVLAQLRDHDEPVIRVFRAARPYDGASAFTLVALNPAFDPIEIGDPADCLLIGRVIFFGSPL